MSIRSSHLRIRLLALVSAFLPPLLTPLAASAEPGTDPFSDRSRVLFTNLMPEDGLCPGGVRSVIHDVSGYTWFGTATGLNRYDGYEVVSYHHDPEDPNSLSGDDISVVYVDSKRQLWVGTRYDGLNRFDPAKGATRYVAEGEAYQLSHPSVTALLEAEAGWLWVGTMSGLNRYDPVSDHFIVIKAKGDKGLAVSALYEDENGRLWVGTENQGIGRVDEGMRSITWVWPSDVPVRAIEGVGGEGLDELWVATEGNGLVRLAADGTVKEEYRHRAGDVTSLPTDELLSLKRDGEGRLWVGTTQGLCRLGKNGKRFAQFRPDRRDEGSLAGDRVTSIFEDPTGVLWVGTDEGGVSRFRLGSFWFPVIRHRPEDPVTLAGASVTGVAEDRRKAIWVGTSNGLTRLAPETLEATQYRHDPAEKNSLSRDSVSAVLCDRRGRVWVGLRGGGLNLYTEGAGFIHFTPDAKRPGKGPGSATVTTLFEDKDERLWIGGLGSGLSRFDEEKVVFEHFTVEGSNNIVNAITQTKDGILWVAFDRDGLHFLRSGLAEMERYPLPANLRDVTALHADGEGQLWIGTKGKGLARLELLTGKSEVFTPENTALPEGAIVGIVSDQEGQLWLSTSAGIARFDPASGSVRVFDRYDGLQDDLFHRNAICSSRSGRLYFGGPRGLNVIDPGHLPAQLQPQRAILTGLEMFGEPVEPREGTILEKKLALTDELLIPYDARNRMALTFATLDYARPRQSKFRFRLTGLEEEWTMAGEDRKATYTGLAPGSYVFEVQASSDGETWNENGSATMPVVILPGWYHTWWARLGFVLIGISLLGGVFALLVRSGNAKMRRREQELEMERSQAEAALAHQLQSMMVLTRTSEAMRRDPMSGQVLDTALALLREQFKVSRCSIHLYTEEPAARFVVAAERQETPLSSITGLPLIIEGNAFLQEVLASDHSVGAGSVHEDPRFREMRSQLTAMGTQAILAMRTSCVGKPNGMILLQDCYEHRNWLEEEIHVLESFAGQVGIAIAQIALTEKEEHQRAVIEEAREAAVGANEAKSQFLAKMTHELRTPLNAIIGFSRLLSEEESTSAEQCKTLDIINSSGEHLLEVINDVLEVSKIEAGGAELNEEAFELLPMLESVHQMLSLRAEATGLELELFRHGDLPDRIIADKSKLRQVLINLLGNSVKFTKHGGIALRVAAVEATDAVGEIDVHFEVRDTGCGIAAEELPKLFEQFTQTESGRKSSQGTGLGLAIAKSFVELMGGQISVTSEVGAGTAFRFFVRCRRPAPAAIASLAEMGGPKSEALIGHGVKGLAPGTGEVVIVLAEDQPMNRLLGVKILTGVGFTVIEAENGQVAVDQWREHRPRLILMDEDMPELCGREATRAILEEAGDDPPVIIALTAYALDDARTAAMEAGCTDFLPKPYKNEELFAMLAKHLNIAYDYGEKAAMAGAEAG